MSSTRASSGTSTLNKACHNCRTAKVRCKFTDHNSGQCVRCREHNRTCETIARKPRASPINRQSEIDALSRDKEGLKQRNDELCTLLRRIALLVTAHGHDAVVPVDALRRLLDSIPLLFLSENDTGGTGSREVVSLREPPTSSSLSPFSTSPQSPSLTMASSQLQHAPASIGSLDLGLLAGLGSTTSLPFELDPLPDSLNSDLPSVFPPHLSADNRSLNFPAIEPGTLFPDFQSESWRLFNEAFVLSPQYEGVTLSES